MSAPSVHADRRQHRRADSTRLRLRLALGVLVAVSGCSPGPEPELRTLPSGEQVSILSVSVTEPESGYRTLHVAYSTDRPVGDHLALLPEVADVWGSFLGEADRERYDAFMISPHARGLPNAETTFPFTRSADGGWDAPRALDLESGARVLLLYVDADHEALSVDYVTVQPIRHLCGLATQADEVFAEFKDDAAAKGVQRVFVVPHETPLGPSVALAYGRNSPGEWSRRTTKHCD